MQTKANYRARYFNFVTLFFNLPACWFLMPQPVKIKKLPT